MASLTIKLVFYAVYLTFGFVISLFLPELTMYVFGYAMALLTRWCWNVMTDKEVDNG